MDLKLRDIFSAQPVLMRMSQTVLPFKTSYRLSRILSKLKDEVSIIDAKRVELIKKYGTETSKEVFTVDHDKVDLFKKEFDEVLDVDTTVEIPQFTLDLLEPLSFSSDDLINLKKFIKEE